MGVRASMGRVDDGYGNAMVGSFFATIECERIDRRNFHVKVEARLALFRCIEGWYDHASAPQCAGYRSPANFERSHRDESRTYR